MLNLGIRRHVALKGQRVNGLVFLALVLSVVSLYFERSKLPFLYSNVFTNILDFSILILFLSDIIVDFLRSSAKRIFVRRNVFNIAFTAAFLALFVYNKYLVYSGAVRDLSHLPAAIIVVRNIFILLKVFGRIRRISSFVKGFSLHPARTVMISFALAIVTGGILLIQPFATVDAQGLGPLDALFTATSAVCVTGLIVVDTGTAFTIWGKIVIIGLIQIGGLGIMILSSFGVFFFRKAFTVEDKLLVSYMLSERDMTRLGSGLKSIIAITLGIETAGFLLLYLGMGRSHGFGLEMVFSALFHSISAFCNAGFSLFSDSLEGFRSDPFVMVVVAFLIIAGGISFVVILNAARFAAGKERSLTLNTRIVLIGSVFLIILGMFVIYGTEHGRSMARFDLKTQYLSAFFQSVTLRTAGFNSISMAGLSVPTYLFMAALMFVGGASGSTAGGIKINSIAVLLAHVRAVLQDKNEPAIMKQSLSRNLVQKTFVIFLFGIAAVSSGTLLLSAVETAPLEQLFFEAVSAFATVGLSAGVTSGLSETGRMVIIILMYMGRIGPLTIFAAAAVRQKKVRVAYPQANIQIG